jgi:uncharacterized membrane protein (DUF485 family)
MNDVTVIERIKADKNYNDLVKKRKRRWSFLIFLSCFFSLMIVTPLAFDLLKRAFLAGF